MRALHAALCLLVLVGAGCGTPGSGHDTLYQVSTLDALVAGQYDGVVTAGELLDHGDFGLGTFHGLDGEMVVLDAEAYQVRMDGHAMATSARVKAPFAAVTWFEPDITRQVEGPATLEDLHAQLDSMLPSRDGVYAVRIQGEFDVVKARSVPEQKKPYPPLKEVLEHQAVFNFRHKRGTLVGFYCPESLRGVNAAGYHLHFLDELCVRGGHVLDCRMQRGTISLDTTGEVHLVLER
jgi:acetolactate decarboxylase